MQPRTRNLGIAAALGASLASGALRAAEPDALARCAAIDEATARLACYDEVAGRASTPSVPPGRVAPAPAEAPPTAGDGLKPPRSYLAQTWELDDATKRGTFNFIGYRSNFMLPVHVTDRINRSPVSPTRAAVLLPDYRNTEAKIQLSFKTKLAQSVLLPGADVWFGFTQQSLWQLWNSRASSPFRNTDYEPEVMYVVPVRGDLRHVLPWGWQWRYAQLALAHQSNGQAKPLSRSWNRTYVGLGAERGDFNIVWRVLRRLPEKGDENDNPDITNFRGRGDLQLGWNPGGATATLLYRNTLRSVRRGALQFDWTYPVESDKPAGLRWYVQVFTGYGETLTDYNFRQTSYGVGLTLFDF